MKAARRAQGLLVPVNMPDIYRQVGSYTIKFLIDADDSPHIILKDVTIKNADGELLDMSFRRWGTKLTVSFKIDERVPDGAALMVADMEYRGEPRLESHRIWVIK